MRSRMLLIYGFLCLFFPLEDFAQQIDSVQLKKNTGKNITGLLLDKSTGKGISGATIRFKNTPVTTLSDSTGKFVLQGPAGAKTLQVSCIGYTGRELEAKEGEELKILLSVEEKEMTQVVVTGYTQQSRAKTSGAVTTLKNAALVNVPVASFDVMLQGRVPGLYVGTPTGQPGEAGRITLRGMGSINGDVQPLYIIDGIQVSNTSFAGLNPDDFETVTVLKDAASTAQYGSRAANGVIVITTKKGSSWDNGRTRVDYKSYIGVSTANNAKWDQMNTTQRLQFEEIIKDPSLPGWEYSPKNPDKLVNGVPVAKTPDDFAFGNHYLDSLRRINTDWRKYLLRTGITNSHGLSLSGRNENTSFYLSFAYLNQQGIALNSGIERYSLRSNLQNTSGRLTSTLNVGLVQSNISYIQNEGVAPEGGSAAGGGGISADNPIAALYFALPYEKPDPDHTGPNNIGSNALNEYAHSSLKKSQLKSVLSLNEVFRLSREWQLTGTVGLEYQQDKVTNYLDPNSYFGKLVSNGNQGLYQDSMTMRYRVMATGGVRYSKRWGTDHEIEANLLAETNRSNGSYFGYTGYGLSAQLPNSPAGITPGTPTNNFIPNVAGNRVADNLLLSQIALLRYSYGNRYTLSASLRRDGTSQVPPNARNIFLYALGGKWNLLQESFMGGQNTFSTLQVRASYGITANAGGFSSDYGYRVLYGMSNYGGNPAVIPQSPGNPNYTWELNRSSNIGTEFGFFRNRIYGALDLYNRITENLFVNKNLSLTSGWPAVAANLGKIRNRGVELELNGDIIKNRDLRFTLGINLAYNQNTVLSLGEDDMQFYDPTSVNMVGRPLGTFYAVRWKGVDPQTGAPVYLDKSGKSTDTYNPDDAVPLKAIWDPPYKGGVTLSVAYKRLECSMLISFIHGMSRLHYPYLYSHSADPNYRGYNQSADMLNIWQKPGDVTPFQGAQYTRQVTSDDVRSSDYVKLRNVSVNYSLPVSPAMAGYVHGIKLFVQGQNLLSFMKWKGFDPEDANDIAQYEYPMPRTITAGLNVSF